MLYVMFRSLVFQRHMSLASTKFWLDLCTTNSKDFIAGFTIGTVMGIAEALLLLFRLTLVFGILLTAILLIHSVHLFSLFEEYLQ